MSTEVAIPQGMQDLLKQRLAEQAVQETGNQKIVYISTKGKRFRIGDEKLPDKFDAVIATAAFEKTYYTSNYDPNAKAIPSCFALGIEEPNGPHENSSEKQATACASCKFNEFGSASVGKGKACKDARRLILYAYGPNGIDFSQVATLKVSATSIKAWSAYCTLVRRRYGLPVGWVVTTISFVEDADYPQLEFTFKSAVENSEQLLEVENNMQELKKIALRPFSLRDEDGAQQSTSQSRGRSKMSG